MALGTYLQDQTLLKTTIFLLFQSPLISFHCLTFLSNFPRDLLFPLFSFKASICIWFAFISVHLFVLHCFSCCLFSIFKCLNHFFFNVLAFSIAIYFLSIDSHLCLIICQICCSLFLEFVSRFYQSICL